MSSFKFSVDTPAAKRLIALTFEKLKEIWDPDAKDAVAIYAVALAAKGWERKKVFGKLVELLKPDDACNMLLDWLLPYIKKHRNELVAEPPPSKAAAAPPAKAEPAVKAEQAPQSSHAATVSAAAAPMEEAPVDDVEALLQEELPSDMMTDLEDEPHEQQQEGWASDASPNQQPEQQADAPAEAAPILRTSSTSGQRLASQKSEEAPGAHAKEDGRRGRMKSVIQWSAPVPGEHARQPGTKESKLAPELAARRARFLGQAGTSDAAAEPAAGKARERASERDKGAEREREQRERDNGRRGMDRPLDTGWRGSRDGDHDRPGATAGRRSRSRSPPGPRGARERDRERIREPGGWGRDEPHRDGHPHDRRDHPSDRRRMQATAPPGHPDGPHVEWGRNGPTGRHDEPWGSERPHPLSPPGEPSRQRLRSTVSGGLDGLEEGGAAGGRAAAGAAAGRGLGISRLLQGALVSTSLASRISKPRAVLRGRLGAAADGQLEEGEAPPGGREAHVGGRAAASRARASGDGEEEAGERPKSIFERLARGNAVAPGARPRSTGSKRHASSVDDPEEPSQDMNGNAPDRTKAQRTEVTRRMGSAVLSAPRPTAQPMAAAAQPAAAAPSQAAATAAAAAATAGLRAKVAAQVPLLPGGVKPALPRQASLAASTVAQARVRHAAQQQATAAATGAAGSSQPAKPAAAAAAAARPVPVNIMGQPVGTAAKTNGATAAAVNPAQAQMALIKEELRRKALEIERIKGQIALQEVLADQGTPDSRSIFVQGLHPHVSKELLAEFFRQCGAVVNVNIIYDPLTQMVCGAYVEFGRLEAQARALALDRRKFMEQVLIIKPKPIKQAPPRAAPTAFNASAGVRRLADAAPLPAKVPAKAKTWTRVAPQPVVNQ